MITRLIHNYQTDKKVNKNFFIDSDCELEQEVAIKKHFIIPTLFDRQQLSDELIKEEEVSEILQNTSLNRKNRLLQSNTNKKKKLNKNDYLERLYCKAQENNNKVSKLLLNSKKTLLYDSSVLDISFNPKKVSYSEWMKIQENIKLNIRYSGFKSIKPIGIDKTYEEYLEEQVLNSEINQREDLNEEPVGIFKLSVNEDDDENRERPSRLGESFVNDYEQSESENFVNATSYIPVLRYEESDSDNDEANQAIDSFVEHDNSNNNNNNNSNERSLFLESDSDNEDEQDYNPYLVDETISEIRRRERWAHYEGPLAIREQKDENKQ